MKEFSPYDDDEELWHPSGWSPVYAGAIDSPRHLVGFTTLQVPVDRFVMTRPHTTIEGAFVMGGEARRVLRGDFYGWTVPDGDWSNMPDFWAI